MNSVFSIYYNNAVVSGGQLYMPTKGNIAFSGIISHLIEVMYCYTDILYRSSCAMTSIKTMYVGKPEAVYPSKT